MFFLGVPQLAGCVLDPRVTWMGQSDLAGEFGVHFLNSPPPHSSCMKCNIATLEANPGLTKSVLP